MLPLLVSLAAASPLSEQLVGTCAGLDSVDVLEFTFIVDRDGEQVASRHHVWNRDDHTILVSEGGVDTTVHLRSDMPRDAEDPRWAELAPGVEADRAQVAWSSFVNDQFWLLAHCKADDPGATVTDLDDHTVQVAYGDVGVTPGDRYVYTLDPETHRPTSWTFHLASGREGTFAWTDWQEVGPMTLSLDRPSADGNMRIHFADVTAR